MTRTRSTRRLLLLAAFASIIAPVVGSQAVATPAKPAKPVATAPAAAATATPTELRASLALAYARTYSIAEILIGAIKPYSVACNDPKSYTTLMMIDMMISRAIEVKKSLAPNLANAAGMATKDAAANEMAQVLVDELSSLDGTVATLMEPAQRCKAWMEEKARAADAASADGDMTWNAARSHASINVMRLAEFDVTAELKEARLLVERTK